MPKSRLPSNTDKSDVDAIARAISEQLPGWKLAQKQFIANEDGDPKLHADTHGPTLKELRRKFLGGEETDDAADDTSDNLPETDTVSVLVEPENGGPAKVADIVQGKVKLVQG